MTMILCDLLRAIIKPKGQETEEEQRRFVHALVQRVHVTTEVDAETKILDMTGCSVEQLVRACRKGCSLWLVLAQHIFFFTKKLFIQYFDPRFL